MNNMQNIVETCSIAVSLLALGAVLLFVLINLYLIKRNGFHVNANCWFCNSWMKVLYSDRDSFVCTSCQQYNGFTEDGGYNRVIEAQHAVISSTTKTANKTENHSNGLCTYCNNNQQLKVVQLAKFTPLNEDNYDVEVDHFRKQLEKVYKLCKKCENVLKTTIAQKHKWIFGNRLKSLKKKGLSLLDSTKSRRGITKIVKQSLFLQGTRFTLLLLTFLIAVQVLNIKVDYPVKDLKLQTLKMLGPYKLILTDLSKYICHTTRIVTGKIENLNLYLPKDIKIEMNNLTLTSFIGFLLQTILLLWDRKATLWKVTEQLNWTILIVTSVIAADKRFLIFITSLQIISLVILLYSYLNYKLINNTTITYSKRKYEFKKLNKPVEIDDSSEEEEEMDNQLSTSSSSTKSKRSTFKDLSRSYRASSPFVSYPFLNDTNYSNNTFRTAQSIPSTTVFNQSVQNSDSDLNRSLDNLHLNFGVQSPASPVFSLNSVKRPVLSPSKLKNITQNPWTAGGFWKHDINILAASPECTNFSRSSSQSSGFVSCNEPANIHFSSLPPSRDHSLCGDVERSSILSEPAYHFNPINSRQLKSPVTTQQLYYKADNNTFYPVLSQNNMLFIQSCLPQQNPGTSFGSTSLKNFSTGKGNNMASLFSEKPMAGLFKNLQGVPVQTDVFRKPQQ